MLARLKDGLREEARVALRIADRDLPKQLSALSLVLLICLLDGMPVPVLLAIGGAAVGTDLLVLALARRQKQRDSALEPQAGAVWALLLLHAAGTIAYLVPSLALAGSASVPMMVAGIIWLLGCLVHVTYTWVALPIHCWAQVLPALLAAAEVVRRAATTAHADAPLGEWWGVAALMLVSAMSALDVMAAQRDTQRELDLIRQEANARLRALETMTRQDGLTGLLNRQAFDEAATAALARLPADRELAVLLIDLDGFKPINDSYSHDSGDAVLRAVAARLTAIGGDEGIVARRGGDEFAMAIPGLTSARAALRYAEAVARRIELPIEYEGKQLRITASIGVALSGAAGRSIGQLSSAADQAMYSAKTDRNLRTAIFDAATFAPRLNLHHRQAVVDAIAATEIRAWYQPKVRLDTGALCGFEALARWQHPDRGLLMPGEFLPQIEQFGLHSDFTAAITRQVLADVGRLLADGLDPGQVSINVPEVVLATHSGIGELDRMISANREAAQHLTLEITEDVFIARAGGMIQAAISRFRRSGLRISLDDFGTGFASFQHLRQLEFDELKIDTSFVQGLGSDRAAEVLVQGFLQIAAGLGVCVIAEGVETDEQRAHLLRMGCVYGQGWRFGKAVPFEEARIRLFAETARRPPPVGRTGSDYRR